MKSKTLKVEIYSRGKEVYGLTYPKSEFNKSKFLEDHEENYHELSGDSLESEVPIQGSMIMIDLDDEKVCINEVYNEGYYINDIKVMDSKKTESYRNLLHINDEEIGVIWFHDYVNTKTFTFENINEFDPSKLIVYSTCRIDDTDNSKYNIVSHIVYDGNEAGIEDFHGSPKSGYFGPYII
ncbi:MAG: hypothetical protein FJZ43_04175 [Candidatus Staskawiczbacteria bacterium]|nr:hypothetical protein [Candidatus Staskawiczbacteria bacterium]